MGSSQKEACGGLEWRVRANDGDSRTLAPESAGPLGKAWVCVVLSGLMWKVRRFLEKAWGIGIDEPRKVIHCLKVGIALTTVSLFYYMRPLYQGVGGNAMWAVMTVVVLFEYTVGATLSKSFNRTTATFLAGSLGVGVNWVATQSGQKFQPVILGASVFLLASATTFSRFIPTIKARFDYGALIFILTFSLVSVSGYRVEKLLDMANQRLSTIVIGASMCLIISMLICPIWAGEELQLLVTRNMEKLANSLDACMAEYFNDCGNFAGDNDKDSHKVALGYRCVLNSKATEDSLANFARWEPAHGNFSFRHPWKQYLKVTASMRNCAYCIEALSGRINAETDQQAPDYIKKHLSNECLALSSISSSILRELAINIKSMRTSSTIHSSVEELNRAVEDIQSALKSLPNRLIPPHLPITKAPETEHRPSITSSIPLIEVLPLATVASLLIEIAARIQPLVNVVDKLANSAGFKPAESENSNQSQSTKEPTSECQNHEALKVLQQV
ncbi:PREDICTED: aluminum-activated malate transporter 10 [Nelumbo nucifera]|uniref:Aluminum-activated malate transporter 10-like n=2 Tax=Nelumbo nucifera TaxID=4432 RepID=A0A822YPU9_NELNU|nr:PREDICTED: aluminum-activated malate transporter 10 [Nelumbo nucifera]DAD36194.1 TPA_asm: hypothetical protein HUJ06_006834 [Nelumbo nucifera]